MDVKSIFRVIKFYFKKLVSHEMPVFLFIIGGVIRMGGGVLVRALFGISHYVCYAPKCDFNAPKPSFNARNKIML